MHGPDNCFSRRTVSSRTRFLFSPARLSLCKYPLQKCPLFEWRGSRLQEERKCDPERFLLLEETHQQKHVNSCLFLPRAFRLPIRPPFATFLAFSLAIPPQHGASPWHENHETGRSAGPEDSLTALRQHPRPPPRVRDPPTQ